VTFSQTYDLLIIGGGVNGAGIARDAAGRGLSVLLVEQDDLASHTSSASTKLIHGGLRYLEYYEFRLVREALMERERLLEAAPHIIWPLRFVLPHPKGLRPAWFVRLGLFLYDHLAPRKRLPGTERLDLRTHAAGRPLKPGYDVAFAYSDCWVEDSRLVVLAARDAAERGAHIHTRTRLVDARRDGEGWMARIAQGMTEREVRAKVVVNTAGPWVAQVLNAKLGLNADKRVRLVKGSHIVVPRIFEGPQAYIFQNPDKRIVFAIPYERDFTLIGTTDIPYEGDPGAVAIDQAELDYLCAAANRFFDKQIAPSDIVRTYSGVRPLYDDGSSEAAAVTRDYVFDLDAPGGRAPVLSVFGGKITTFRRLAEEAMEKLGPFFPDLAGPWTERAPLPGGDMPSADFDAFLADLRRRKPFLPADLAHRLARAYGTRIDELLGDSRSLSDLGDDFGGGLTTREIDHLVAREWARTSQDILWRRSKLGIHVPEGTRERLDAYLEGETDAAAAQ
jgi:glycerol-3-phosphate dehydrogenase